MKQDNDGIAWHYGVYAQDSFKVNAKLTLEYGLRWEYHPPFTDTGSDITNFDRAVPLTGRVIIPNKQQALQITAPGFLQSIKLPGSFLQRHPMHAVPDRRQSGLSEHSAFFPEEGLQSAPGLRVSPVCRHAHRGPRRGGTGGYRAGNP